MKKHLTDSLVEHQLKQQQMISEQQQKVDEQQQKISQLQDESKQLKQKLVANEKHQHRQELMISQLQGENKELKQRLLENEWLNSGAWNWCGPAMLSRCGRVLLWISAENELHYRSEPFLAHHSGYMARIQVEFSGEQKAAKPEHLCVSLRPDRGSHDDKLTWPFKFLHTITLLDQQDDAKNISRTIDPCKFDDSLATYCFGSPSVIRALDRDRKLPELHIRHAMLCVPWRELNSRSYIKNNTIIIGVEVASEV